MVKVNNSSGTLESKKKRSVVVVVVALLLPLISFIQMHSFCFISTPHNVKIKQ